MLFGLPSLGMHDKLGRITGALKARHNKAQGGRARDSGLWNPGIQDGIGG